MHAFIFLPILHCRCALDPDPDVDLAGYPVNLVDPGRIRIRLDPMYLDLARIWIWPALR